jgi:DNA polymerase-3 subunit gamma/tau
MSYQVIARKYRPQRFEEVVGQDHITKTLQNAITAGRIHHAYLFAGARGIGKTTVARILAKSLNCASGPVAEPCGTCSQCVEIAGGTSLDVQEIDGASNTGVDDVREIRERVKYMPAGSRYKIYIIDEVHMLSTAAFNALLKTLEEPPPHVVFIFATTEPHKIPATILSRCQRYDFRRIPSSRISKSLADIAKNEGVTIDEESLSLISREATGSLRDAQSLLDQAIAFAGKDVKAGDIKSMLGFLDRKLTFDILDAVFAKDAKKALDLLNDVFDMGADLVRFTMDFLECLRHVLVIKECGFEKGLLDVPQDEADILNKLASKNTAEEAHQMFNVWYMASDNIARSPFPKMLLEVLLMRLTRVEPVRPIAELIEEIEALTQHDVIATPSSSRGKQSHEIAAAPAGPRNDERREKQGGDWDGFVKWLSAARPQIASIFGHGSCSNLSPDVVEIVFDNPFYADMLLESERKEQVEGLLRDFFKRPVSLMVKNAEREKKAEPERAESEKEKIPEGKTALARERRKVLTKEALETDIVREAAKIFNATVHDVHVEEDE